MLDYGTTHGNSNWDSFADNNNWDSFTSYSLAAWIRRRNAWGALTNKVLWGKSNLGTTGWYWNAGGTTANRIGMVHRAAGGTTTVEMTADMDLDTTQSVIISWDGSTDSFFKNNVAAGTPAQTRAIDADTGSLVLGSGAASTTAAYAGAHFAIWKNYQLTAAERAVYHGGDEIPSLGRATFWCRGILAVTGELDEISLQTYTESGTVVALADTVDSYYSGSGMLSMFIGGIFLPFMAGSAALLGQNLMSEAVKVKRFLDRRCYVDLQKWELRELLQQYRQRPSFAF